MSEVARVKELCTLDIQKYACVTPGIAANAVVITEERIRHIKEHHPNDYERYASYIPEIISDPDYIIQDDRPRTAMVLKEFTGPDARFRLALRLVTAEDHPGYKNSVITFLKIREREWKRLIQNKEILYKRE